jgi:hypothetical protein
LLGSTPECTKKGTDDAVPRYPILFRKENKMNSYLEELRLILLIALAIVGYLIAIKG